MADIARHWAGAARILYVPGNHEYYGSEIDVARRELARQCLQHGAIRHDGGRDGLLTTRECARRHAGDRAFIEAELVKTQASGLTPVVITHHAPSARCIRPWFEGSRLNPGFASDLDWVIARYQPALWVHGHMHDCVDESLGETRVMCNPRGVQPGRGA